MFFEETGLPWVPTSPHVPQLLSPLFLAITGGMGELQSINNGVGYTLPFELIGSPWIDADEFAGELNNYDLPGIIFRPVHYQPFYFNFQNQDLYGVQIHVTDKRIVKPVATQIYIMAALQRLYPDHSIFNPERIDMFDKAMGTDKVRIQLEEGKSAETIIAGWQHDLEKFDQVRSKYCMY